jgi:hypothetical protein
MQIRRAPEALDQRYEGDYGKFECSTGDSMAMFKDTFRRIALLGVATQNSFGPGIYFGAGVYDWGGNNYAKDDVNDVGASLNSRRHRLASSPNPPHGQ